MAELADALDSGSSVRKDVEVRILSWAPCIPKIYADYFALSKIVNEKVVEAVDTSTVFSSVTKDWRSLEARADVDKNRKYISCFARSDALGCTLGRLNRWHDPDLGSLATPLGLPNCHTGSQLSKPRVVALSELSNTVGELIAEASLSAPHMGNRLQIWSWLRCKPRSTPVACSDE